VAGRRWRPFSSAAPEGEAWGGRYYYLKHAPFVYSRSVMRAVNTLFRPQILKTYTHKFRNGDDVITPLLHHGVAAAVSTALLAAKDIGAGVNGSRAGVGADGEAWTLGEMGLELARNMSEGWYGAEGLSPLGVDVDGLPHVVEVETLVGNAVLLQSGSKAGFFLCHLRDRPVTCELLDGKGPVSARHQDATAQHPRPVRLSSLSDMCVCVRTPRSYTARSLLAKSKAGASHSTTMVTRTCAWRMNGEDSQGSSCQSQARMRPTCRRQGRHRRR
jgi:hypothetical protein